MTHLSLAVGTSAAFSPRRFKLPWIFALVGLFWAPGCSSKDWAAPPSTTRDDAANAALLRELSLLMKEQGLWSLELEDTRAGIKLAIDRRAALPPAAGLVLEAQPRAQTGAVGAASDLASGSGAGVPAGPAGSASPGSGGALLDGAAQGTQALQSPAGAGGPGAASANAVAAAGTAPTLLDAAAARQVDAFHPDCQPGPDGQRPPALKPVFGGRLIVHLSGMPKHLNYVTENSSVTRRMLYELTETLLLQDWRSHDLVPNVAESYVQEDMLVLRTEVEDQYPQATQISVRPRGQGAAYQGRVLYGRIEDLGQAYKLTPLTSGGSALSSSLNVPKSAVESLERGCALTFRLRPGVRWQPAVGTGPKGAYKIDNQTLDAADVCFSWSIYSNPGVECNEKRFQYEKISACEQLGPLEVRFLAREQYYATVDSLGRSMTLLPRHLFDLSDPDSPWFDPQASPEEQAEHINQNPHNQLWVGLGAYQVTQFDQQFVEAQRFEGYFDKSRPGYFDTLRWRYIADDNLAFQALLNGELDFFERVKSADYFSPATESEVFKQRFYKGYKYLGTYGYTGWNTHRPYLADKRVRQAFAHAFPFDEYLKTTYKNLARQTTGPFPVDSEAYDHSVRPYPYDLVAARRLLTEAGFIDTDGNGYVDKDGRDLVLEFLIPSGNEASKTLGLKMKEEFGRIGVGLELAPLEWATFIDRTKKRDFDACNLAWVPDLESDPEQTWHSKWGQPNSEGSNNSGIREPELDALIEAGQREIDHAKRQEIWHSIHRFLHDWQPYLFGYNVPAKFAVSKRLHGLQNFAPDPGYSLREWHFVSLSEPGTRPTLER